MNKYAYGTMPQEVMEAIALTSSGYVGQKGMDKYNAAVKKYPEWFPDETKYREIPVEVHKEYYLEMAASEEELRNPREEPMEFKMGSLTLEIFESHCKEYFEKKNRHRTESKRIWNKHYAKYGLRK